MLSVDTNPPSTFIARSTPRIRVGMILDQPFPAEPRVEREAVALVEAGYEVHLLCLLHPNDVLVDEAYRGFYIHRVDPNAVSIEIPWLGRPTHFLYQGLFRQAFLRFKNIDTPWHTLIHRFTRNYDIQVLHVHGLRLLDTTLNISTRYGIPLVADLPDHYPALMQLTHSSQREKASLALRNRWELLEARGVELASRVLTATTESRQRLLRKGVHPDLMTTIENSVEIETVMHSSVDMEIIKRFKSNFVVTHVGRLSDSFQGIQTVLEAMNLLRDHIPEMVFINAGPIREGYRRQLLLLIEAHNLQDKVHLAGRVDDVAEVSYIDVSDVCIFPYLPNDQTNSTFPEALYRCQALKKPVLTGNTRPLQQYVEESGGGAVFPAGNAAVLAEMLYTLYTRPDLRRDMSLNGHQTVVERYHWAHSAHSLTQLYHHLTGYHAEPIADNSFKQTDSFDETTCSPASRLQ